MKRLKLHDDQLNIDHLFNVKKEQNSSSIILFIIISLILGAVSWAWMTKLEQVVRTAGSVIPDQQIRILQAVEGSTVSSLLTTKGSIVAEGKLLIALDSNEINARIEQLSLRETELLLRRTRLTAEINNSDYVEFDSESGEAALRLEELLFQERYLDRENKVAETNKRLFQKKKQINELEAIVDVINSDVALVANELDTVSGLATKKLATDQSLFELRRTLNAATRNRMESESSIDVLRSEVSSLTMQKQSIATIYTKSALDDMINVETELSQIQSQLPALKEKSKKLMMTSPMRAVVNEIMVDGIGAVVQTGQPLIELVPISSEPIIEAYLDPKDLSSIYVGQKVIVKITTYDFSRYGGINGEVMRIGSNTIKHPNTNVDVFSISVKSKGSLFDDNGNALPVIPGMTVELDLLGEKRRVADYFLGSLNKVKSKALRE